MRNHPHPFTRNILLYISSVCTLLRRKSDFGFGSSTCMGSRIEWSPFCVGCPKKVGQNTKIVKNPILQKDGKKSMSFHNSSLINTVVLFQNRYLCYILRYCLFKRVFFCVIMAFSFFGFFFFVFKRLHKGDFRTTCFYIVA